MDVAQKIPCEVESITIRYEDDPELGGFIYAVAQLNFRFAHDCTLIQELKSGGMGGVDLHDDAQKALIGEEERANLVGMLRGLGLSDPDEAGPGAPARSERHTPGDLGAPGVPWHEQLHPTQFVINSGPTTLLDPDTCDWRVEVGYTFAGKGRRVGGEDRTEKAAVLRMLDSLKTSIEADWA